MRRSESAATKRFGGGASILRRLRYSPRRLNSVLTQTQPVTAPSNRHLARTALAAAAIAALWFILCRQLSGEWSVNEQYNYGWFVPFFALYLFWLRWEDRPIEGRYPPRSNFGTAPRPSLQIVAILIGVPTLFLLLPVRLFEIANPEWRPVAWIDAALVVTLTLLYLWYVGGRPWLRHFAFPVAFVFVAVPWVTPVEAPIIQGLMRAVARVAAETVMLLGIPAHLEGNLIRVSNGLVGVNEACSGIRSLQTSLMIGLLFGELKRLSVLRRVVLVACAVAIALLANFVRAVFLVRIAATENLSEVGRWHDIAGYTIIALVFVTTMALVYLLGRRKTKNSVAAGVSPAKMREPQPAGLPLQSSAAYLMAALCWLLFVEIGTASWYRLHERNLISGIRWSVRWPEQAPNFRRLKIDEEIRAVLRFDEGEAAAWSIQNRAEASPIACSLFAFRWKPGKNSALLANLHRPDVCLPASGWKQMADLGVRSYPISDSVEMPFRHFEFQRSFEGSALQTAHAFYYLSEDRASEGSASLGNTDSPGMFGNRSEWTRSERLRAVLDGRRHLGQQVIEAIFISSEPLSAADAESHMRDLVRDVVTLREAD